MANAQRPEGFRSNLRICKDKFLSSGKLRQGRLHRAQQLRRRAAIVLGRHAFLRGPHQILGVLFPAQQDGFLVVRRQRRGEDVVRSRGTRSPDRVWLDRARRLRASSWLGRPPRLSVYRVSCRSSACVATRKRREGAAMLEKILGALLPAVITILLGYFAARHHDFEQKEVPTLNRMVMSYALPLSLFVGVVSAGREELLADLPLGDHPGDRHHRHVCGHLPARPFRPSLLRGPERARRADRVRPEHRLRRLGGAWLSLRRQGATFPWRSAASSSWCALVPVTLIILSLEATEAPTHRRGTQPQTAPPRRGRLGQDPGRVEAAGGVAAAPRLRSRAHECRGAEDVAPTRSRCWGTPRPASRLFTSGIILAGYKIVVNRPGPVPRLRQEHSPAGAGVGRHALARLRQPDSWARRC